MTTVDNFDTSTKDGFSNRLMRKLMNVRPSKMMVLGLMIASILSGGATYVVMTQRPEATDTVFWLINVDLGLFLLLAILVARQIAKLWAERKQGLAGSQLHVRLVFIFGLLTAAPAILMTLFSAAFFYFGVQAWFSDRVSTAVQESLVVAEAYLDEHKQTMRADVLAMANDLNREAGVLTDNMQALNQFVQAQSQIRDLSEVMVFTSSGRVLARSKLTFTLEFDPIPETTLNKAAEGRVVLLLGDGPHSEDRVRALVKLDQYVDTYLLVGRLVDEKVIRHLNSAKDAVKGYAELEGKRSSFQLSIIFMFLAVALLLLLVAVWFGLVFAGQLVRPISQLISASERVRSGDFSARVEHDDSDDELGALGASFNRMTTQLAEQRDELIEANRQIDDRRRFTEAVLANTSSGIIGINDKHEITLANPVAANLFGVAHQEDLINKNLVEFVPEVEDLFSRLVDTSKTHELEYDTQDGVKRILSLRVTKEINDDREDGFVLTFDDVSPLVAAQRKAAWSDVARRIAHEIKNPLTPIQLSAERLNKKYLPQITEDPETFEKCTDTIVRQVEQIGRMVKEFSDFARLPEAVKEENNVVQICQEAMIFQKQATPNITFSLVPSKKKIISVCDAGQVSQVLNNVLLNAIQAIEESKTGSEINIGIEDSEKSVKIIIEDDGPGLPEEDIARLTEPYVTTRKKGTGLGLAIVKKILDDHNGSIELDNSSELGGARVVMKIEK